jgi:hypothetical protein
MSFKLFYSTSQYASSEILIGVPRTEIKDSKLK